MHDSDHQAEFVRSRLWPCHAIHPPDLLVLVICVYSARESASFQGFVKLSFKDRTHEALLFDRSQAETRCRVMKRCGTLLELEQEGS
jgi:hypothetical protein